MVQPMISMDKQPIQQFVVAPILTTKRVITSLSTYVPIGFAHHPLDGRQLGDSPRGDLLGRPPFNPHVGSFGWPTLDPCMFIPPWYQPPIMQPIPKPTMKLLYMIATISKLRQRH
jgi:hypothetical protein